MRSGGEVWRFYCYGLGFNGLGIFNTLRTNFKDIQRFKEIKPVKCSTNHSALVEIQERKVCAAITTWNRKQRILIRSEKV